MKFVDEYRDPRQTRQLLDAIARSATRSHTLMEVCGGQTHSIVKFGIDTLLPEQIRLIHGPGCPVCVTSVNIVDKAVAIARIPGVILCSFGDMLRVPGTRGDLNRARAAGGDVRMVYSPLDAVKIAEANPDREVVFFGVGFETTAPVNALAVVQAHDHRLMNFSLLCAQVLVPPAMEAVLSSPACQVQGFLAAGHVCAISGYEHYHRIARAYGVPIVVTGFEPMDILCGILACVRQREAGRAEVENQYARAVRREGNLGARAMMEKVFQVSARDWRGLGTIARSGLALRPPFDYYDAEKRFEVEGCVAPGQNECRSGEVLQGLLNPCGCPAFGVRCTPESPLGAPMVSSEGACAAYYRYGRKGRQPLGALEAMP